MQALKNITLIQWIGVVILFNTTLLGGASQLGDLSLSAGTVKAILAAATLGNGFLGGLITMFGGQGSLVKQVAAMPGIDAIKVNASANQTLAQIAVSNTPEAAKVEATPSAEAAVARTARIVNILIAAFLLSLFLANAPASAAASRRHSAVKTITGEALPCDPANLLPGCDQSAMASSGAPNSIQSLLSQPMQDLANFITNGFDNAVQLSTAVPELQDGNGQACWSMMRNYSIILKDHPIPVTLQAAYDLESIRLLNMAANKICQNTACTQVFTEAGNLVNAAAPMSIPLPNLTALCSKVPDIAVVAPIASPSPSPSPVPVSAPSPAVVPSPSPSPSASP